MSEAPQHGERAFDTIPELSIDQGDAAERGRSRGARERGAIQARLAQRIAQCAALGVSEDMLHAGGRQMLERVAAADARADANAVNGPGPVAEELSGLATGAAVDASLLVWLSASPEAVYETFGVGAAGSARGGVPGPGGGAGDAAMVAAQWREETLLLFVQGPDGPVLGLARRESGLMQMSPRPDPQASQAILSVFVAVPPGDATPYLVIAAPGGLGSLLLTRSGLLIASASLARTQHSPPDAVFHEVVHRQLLRYPRVEDVESASELATLRGRFVAIVDAQNFSGMECAGGQVVRTQKGARTAHLHANHAFDPVLRAGERVVAASTSFDRTIDATTIYAQTRPASGAQVLAFLAEVSSSPPHARRRASGLADARVSAEPPWTLCVAQLLARSVTLCQVSAGSERPGSADPKARWSAPASTMDYTPWPAFAALAHARTHARPQH